MSLKSLAKKLVDRYEDIADPILMYSDQFYEIGGKVTGENITIPYGDDKVVIKDVSEADKYLVVYDHLLYWVDTYLDNEEDLYELAEKYVNDKGYYEASFMAKLLKEIVAYREELNYGNYNVR